MSDEKVLLEIVANYGDNQFFVISGKSDKVTPELLDGLVEILRDKLEYHLGFEPKYIRDFRKNHEGLSPSEFADKQGKEWSKS